MKIAILGYTGQLGTECTFALKDHILGLFNTQNFNAFSPNFSLLDNYDYIINTIYKDKVDIAESNLNVSMLLNTYFVEQLAKYCAEKNKTLFHISTDYVFDGKKQYGEKYIEEDLTNGISIYGITKESGEKLALIRNPKTFIFRISSLFGRKGNNFIETMMNKFSDSSIEEIRMVSNQYMAPTHAWDVAKAIKYFIENKIDDYGIYHCCNDTYADGVTWYEFTKYFIENYNSENLYKLKHISYEQNKTVAKRPKNSTLDNAKICKYYQIPFWMEAVDEYFKLRNK